MDRQKLLKRGRSQGVEAEKGTALINLYVIVAGIAQVIGQLLQLTFLQMFGALRNWLLIYYAYKTNKKYNSLGVRWLQAGLFLNSLSGLLLEVDETTSLLAGCFLDSFSLLCYALSFKIDFSFPLRTEVRTQNQSPHHTYVKLARFGLVLISLITIYSHFSLRPFEIATLFHNLSALTLLWVVLNRVLSTRTYSFWYVGVASAVLFTVSHLNSLRGLHERGMIAGTIRVLSQFIGHFFIVHGAFLHCFLELKLVKALISM